MVEETKTRAVNDGLTVVGGTEARAENEHVPTDWSRNRVYVLSQNGVTQRAIAADLGIAHNTLRRHYMIELIKGDAAVQALIGHATLQEALGHKAEYDGQGHLVRAEAKPNAVLLMFLCKARLGFRDGGPGQVDRGEVSPDDGFEYNTTGLSERERVERIAGLFEAARTRRAGRPVDGASGLGAVSGKSSANGSGKYG